MRNHIASLAKNFSLPLLVLVLGLFNFIVINVQAAPKVQIPNHEFNFGKTLQQVGLMHSFWVKSVGDDTLRITKIVPGCGCMQAPISDSAVAPGDSTRLDIILSTGSYRGFVSKKPYIITNAGEERIFVKIYAQVFPNPDEIGPVKVYPMAVDVSQVDEKNANQEGRFHIKNPTSRDFIIEPEDCTNKSFTVKLPAKIKAGEMVDGILTVRKEALEKEFFESLTFRIDDDELSTFSVAVSRRLLYKANQSK